MGTALLIIFLFGVVSFAMLMGVLSLYNGLSTAKSASQVAFSQMETDMARRYELMAGLVDAARNYMKPERVTLEALLTARNKASVALNSVLGDPSNPTFMLHLLEAETHMLEMFARLKAVAETYPEFKASRNIKLILRELALTGERLMLLVRTYNESAEGFNAQRKAFPSILLASFLGFRAIPLYEFPKPEPPPEEELPSQERHSSKVFYG